MSVKERIIRTLLVSQKTTNEITIALGNEDKKYNAVDKDLKTLQSDGFIHYEKIKIPGRTGPVAKTYDIVYEIPRIKALLIKYPSLISDMHKNDKIISLLTDKHKSDIRFEILGDLLQLSPSFFKNYLTNDLFLERFKKAWFNLYFDSSKVKGSFEYKLLLCSGTVHILYEMFTHCVIEDNINNVHIPDAFEFIVKNQGQYCLAHRLAWRNGYDSAKDDFGFAIEIRDY
jgi:hypothetical protein